MRIATLNAAILRINTSLDLDTVLHEVVDSARGLTGARYGVINLRRKLGDDDASPVWLFNERGVGYRMAKPGEE